MNDADQIQIELDLQVKAGLLVRFRSETSNDFEYQPTDLNVEIMRKIKEGLPLLQKEKEAFIIAGISESFLRRSMKHD